MEMSKCKVQWVNPEDVTRKSFLDDEQVVIKLSKDDPDDHNFAKAVYHFVSNSLLLKAKRYISESQKVSLDIFVSNNIILEEKMSVKDYFLEEFVHPNLEKGNGKVREYFATYDRIKESGHFYPVLLNEMDVIGGKVFGKNKTTQIIREVDDLIEFLEKFSMRKIGEEGECNFNNEHTKFAIMLIGKTVNVQLQPEVYKNYLERHIIPYKYETIYMVGAYQNKSFICDLAMNYIEKYEIVMKKRYDAKIYYSDDKYKYVDNYTLVLKKIGITHE